MIKNENDWWDLLDAYWGDILEIVFHHLDPNHPAYEIPGDANSPVTGRVLHEELVYLKLKKNPKIHRYLNVSWCMASDTYAYSVSGWSQFCDLCSENWVFDEGEETP